MNMSKRTGHFLSLLGLAVFGLYAFLVLPSESSAVTTMTVGILSAEVVPEGTTPELETFSLDYSGPGVMNVSGYTVVADGVPIFTISDTELSDGEKVTFCANGNTATGCVGVWEGEVFADNGGTIVLQGSAGGDVIVMNYSEVGNSTVVRETYERAESVYGVRDHVDLCHTRDAVSYRMAKDQTGKLLAAKGHATDLLDIIPPFFYRLETGINYYAGQNWETGAGTFMAGCK
jgi:hypothetical protein